MQDLQLTSQPCKKLINQLKLHNEWVNNENLVVEGETSKKTTDWVYHFGGVTRRPESPCVAPDSCRLTLLTWPPKCWDCKHVPLTPSKLILEDIVVVFFKSGHGSSRLEPQHMGSEDLRIRSSRPIWETWKEPLHTNKTKSSPSILMKEEGLLGMCGYQGGGKPGCLERKIGCLERKAQQKWDHEGLCMPR